MFDKWRVESLRLTVFHQVDNPPGGLWRQLTGTPPDSRDEQPKLGIYNEQGTIKGNRLILKSQVGRYDWHIVPMPPESNMDIASLLSVKESADLLKEALATTFESLRNPLRLALGVVLFEECADQSECVVRIAEHIPALRAVITGTTDLIFQVNRKRRSGVVPHVQINRIGTWRVVDVHSGNIHVSQAEAPTIQMGTSKSLAKVALDINTTPGGPAISPTNYRKLFAEFLEYANAIALKGDIT